MDRVQLSRYKKNKRDIEKLDGIIEKLRNRLDAVPVVSGKVMKSSDEFPYIEEHVQVQVEEPREATALKIRILEKEQRREQLMRENEEVKKFIDAMPEGNVKDVFEMVYLDGMTQNDVAECLGYTQARISQILKHL